MNSSMDDSFVIVDGSSYLFRAFYALPPLTNKQGQPTGAIYGVVNMLRNLQDQYKTSRFIVVFDSKGKNFRHEIFSEYKANRTEMPEELALQIQPLHSIIKAMGLPLLSIVGVEADDIIGTLAYQAKQANLFTIISTGDKDMAQLVDDKTILVNTMNNTIMDTAGVKEKFQVPPERIVDYLSLVGDTVDNIPGVPKVGPKTAVKWLNTYDNLDEIIANAEKITGKVGENLRASIADIPLYKQLTTIKTDVELGVLAKDIKINSADLKSLKKLYQELEFNKWLQELENMSSVQASTEDRLNADFAEQKRTKEVCVQSEESFAKLTNKIQKAKLVALDTETTSLNYLQAKLVGISLSVESGEGFYIPVGHDYEDVPQQLPIDWVLEQLSKDLFNTDKIIIGHNLKYDLGVLANYNISVRNELYDTMLASYVLNSVAGKHDLDSVSARYINYTKIKYEDVVGKGVKKKNFSEVDIELASKYSAEDADIALRLYHYFDAEFSSKDLLQKVLYEIELPLMPVMLVMEKNGVIVCATSLNKQSIQIGERLEVIKEKIYVLAGEEFNINSPKQLQEILFDKLEIPILSKTPTGQPSTAEPVLEELSLKYELPRLILEFRSLSKLKSTYTDSLPEQINPKTQRVHTSYHQAVTATGRLSSSAPNLQNIPIKNEIGRKIRAAFIAPKGYKIVSADYSQIELRIMAHLSADQVLLSAFANNLDVHSATAAEVFGVEISDVSAEQRRKAKAINFGLMYGMSAFGLSKQIGVSREEAGDYIDNYFNRFPKVKEFMSKTRDQATTNGYVETLFGRRLYLPEIRSKNVARKKASQRAAINAPMQGGQADIIKIAMINIDKWIREEQIDAKMIMQVHDELVFEIADECLDKSIEQIKTLMMGAVKLTVDLQVSVGVGSNWEEAH